jgi:hypothetical protein
VSLLGGILKGVGGFLTGGPAGAIAGVASELFKPKATPATPAIARPIVNTLPVLRPSVNIAQAFPQLPDSTRTSGVVLPGGGLIGTRTTYGPGNQTQSGGGALVGQGQHTPCMAGYHYNRTGYFTKRYGWIEKGTVCVKNRRRNPLNPRALSKALSRLTSAKRAVNVLDRIEVKPRRRGRRC